MVAIVAISANAGGGGRTLVFWEVLEVCELNDGKKRGQGKLVKH